MGAKKTIEYIQSDLNQLKHTIDKVLRPYKGDVKSLQSTNGSLRAGIARIEEDQEKLLRLISTRAPDLLDDALALLLDRNRKGWKKFRNNWLLRLGAEPKVES